LELYFTSKRPGGSGPADIYMTTRATTNTPWAPPINLGATINSPYHDSEPWITADGLELYFGSSRPGGHGELDIYVTTRVTKNTAWVPPVNLGSTINSSANDGAACISADGRTLCFVSVRSGGYGKMDIWMARRASVSHPWEPPVNLGLQVNGSADDSYPRLSLDGRTLYFWSNRSGDWDSYWAQVNPIVDFNGDGAVDAADMCIVVDHWGESYPLCDVGPMPWGDGVVDVQDLIVLAEHLFEEVPLPDELIVYLRLDEQEGDTAFDSAGDSAGLLFGSLVWRPAEGKKDGSIQLDGIDDYISIPYVLNPASGAFTVCAWINGGATGQVIVSQSDGTGYGSTWLGIDPTDGKLMTNLCFFELISEKVITDGQWHHVVLVWNGYRRSLYVDGQEVISDASDFNALSATGDLYIGTSKNLDVGTFFSGLIDDVRIYEKALIPEEIAALSK